VQKRRGADADFQAVWAHVSNQEHQASPRAVSGCWRESVRKSVSVHQDKIRGSAIPASIGEWNQLPRCSSAGMSFVRPWLWWATLAGAVCTMSHLPKAPCGSPTHTPPLLHVTFTFCSLKWSWYAPLRSLCRHLAVTARRLVTWFGATRRACPGSAPRIPSLKLVVRPSDPRHQSVEEHPLLSVPRPHIADMPRSAYLALQGREFQLTRAFHDLHKQILVANTLYTWALFKGLSKSEVGHRVRAFFWEDRTQTFYVDSSGRWIPGHFEALRTLIYRPAFRRYGRLRQPFESVPFRTL